MAWPDFFPEDCPPAEALTPSGIFYRLTKKPTPKPKDFVPYYEAKPNPQRPYPSICQACALSVYGDIADISRLQERVPATRKKSIAQGELSEKHGKILNTPSRETSHHSWWIQVGIEPWTFFRPVDR